MLESGQFKCKAELARHFGVSRVRVVQMLNLLKLDEEVIYKLKRVGEIFNKPLFGEKTLRHLLRLTQQQQKSEAEKLLLKTKGSKSTQRVM